MGACLACLRRSHPKPSGGRLLGVLRARLPRGAPVREHFGKQKGLLAQVHYPAEPGAPPPSLERPLWFREEVVERLADRYGLPRCLLRNILCGVKHPDAPRKPCRDGTSGWPILLFSSGVYGCCEMYTQFCRELAAHGAIVVAIEHEDGSGIYASCQRSGDPVEYVEKPKGQDEQTFRVPFLSQRVQELASSIVAILDLASGAEEAAEETPEEKALADVLRCGDPDNFFLVGHSFGAAGIVRYLGRHGERDVLPVDLPVKGVVLMDIWTPSLPQEDLQRAVRLPYMHLMSHGWEVLYGCGLAAASGDNCLSEVVVRGTRHTWVSDLHLFAPSWILRLFGFVGLSDCKRALRATVSSVWLFLREFTGSGPRLSRKSFGSSVSSADELLLRIVWPPSTSPGATAWSAV